MKRKNLLLTACLAVLASGNVMAADATWTATTVDKVLTDQYFPLINTTNFNLGVFKLNDATLNIFDDATKTIKYKYYYVDGGTKQNVFLGGMVGWEVYDQQTNGWWAQAKNVDFTTYKYLVVQLNKSPECYQEIHYQGTTATINGSNTTYSDQEYTLSLGVESSNHFYTLTSSFNNTTMKNVMRVSLRDGASKEGESIDDCGDLLLSNVFLTNTLPNWDNPVKKIPSANYGTVCLPYNATVAGAYIYQITGKSSDGNSIYITPYNGLLKAGVPYIYKALTTGATVNFYQIESEGTEVTTPSSNGGLVGVFTGNAANGDNYYVIKNDQLYQVNSSDVALTNGAYIDLSKLSVVGGSAKGFSIELGDGTTDISDINKDNTTSKDNAIYTITGVKVSNDQQRGIYIKNGKKYIKNN